MRDGFEGAPLGTRWVARSNSPNRQSQSGAGAETISLLNPLSRSAPSRSCSRPRTLRRSLPQYGWDDQFGKLRLARPEPLNARDQGRGDVLRGERTHCCENSSLLANFIPTGDSIDW